MIDESQEKPGEQPASDATPSDGTALDAGPMAETSEPRGSEFHGVAVEAAAENGQPSPAATDEPISEEVEPVTVKKVASSGKAGSKKQAAVEPPAEELAEIPAKNWYILKVQSNREETISDGLQRRVAIAGLQDYFGEVIVPTEMVTEFKNGKKKIVKRKLYPGYIVVHMAITEETWFLVRDTPGIGDFTGAGGKPIAMQAHEVSRLIAKQEEKTEEAPRLKINFKAGDRVKINEGTFENFEGDVDTIDEQNGRVTVMINIFGRSTPVELEYWQVETI